MECMKTSQKKPDFRVEEGSQGYLHDRSKGPCRSSPLISSALKTRMKFQALCDKTTPVITLKKRRLWSYIRLRLRTSTTGPDCRLEAGSRDGGRAVYMFPIIAVANSEHFTSFAPSICRAKS